MTNRPTGYAVMTREYGEDGNVATESYFGESEEPVVNNGGYHRIDRTWADPKHPSSEAWFGVDGEPVKAGNNAFVRREREYDEAGNVIEERVYDEKGEQIIEEKEEEKKEEGKTE